MRCHVCNVAVGDGQRFCHECGESLAGVTDRAESTGATSSAASTDGPDADPGDPPRTVDERGSASADPADLPTTEHPVVKRSPDGSDAMTQADGPGASAVDDPGATSPSDGDVDRDVAFVPTEELEAQPAPESVATGEMDAQPIPSATAGDGVGPGRSPSEFPATEPLNIVEATPHQGSAPRGGSDATVVVGAPTSSAYDPTTTLAPVGGAAPRSAAVTDEFPVSPQGAPPIFDGVHDVDEYTVTSHRFRLRASFVFAFLGLVATLMAAVADTIDIRTSRPVDGISVGIRVLEDFGTNLPVAGFIGASVMLVGGLLSCFTLRWGAGLAGGAGLAMTGWAAMTIGLVEVPIHTAEGITRNAGATVGAFDLSVTRDLGWFLIAAVGVLGLIVFLTSLRLAGTGGRRGLNPWVAAVGAVGAVILAAGPLIPLSDAAFDVNLGFTGLPRAFFAGRLVMLGLVAFTGVVGFLSVRTYGLGLVAGGLSIATWLWATSLAEFGDSPVSVAVGNLGVTDTMPHAVTSVGIAISLSMLAVAAVLAATSRR